MRFKIRPIGNSAGIIFPVELLKKYNLHIGDDLLAENSDDSIVLTAAKLPKKYNLRDLVAQSIPQDLTIEDKIWLNLEDVGEEVIW